MASFGDDFRLTLLTNDPILAMMADRAGVNNIGLDLEHLGKRARQASEDARISAHKLEDLVFVGRSLRQADLFVRLNPLNPQTQCEVDQVLRLGAKVLMLPFFRTADEVTAFVRLVRRRARVSVLIETASATLRIREILKVPGIDEVMFGLNDLHLEFRVDNHFEVLASPLLDMLAREVRASGLPLGLGGVADPDDLELPVSADLVLAQYPRLGATGAWLSRSSLRNLPAGGSLDKTVSSLRARLSEWASSPPEALERARGALTDQAQKLAKSHRRTPVDL